MVEVSTPAGPPRLPVSIPDPDLPSAGPGAPPSAWRPRLRGAGEVVLCSSLPTQLLVQYAAVLAGIAPWQAPGVPTLAFLAITQLGDTVLLVTLMVLLTRARGESVAPLWRGARPPSGEIRLGLLLVPLVFVLVGGALALAGWLAPRLHNVTENPFAALLDTPARVAVMAVVVVLAGGVREELQRAFLLRRFEAHLGGRVAGVVLLSCAFGAGHYLQGWDVALATGLAGAFWAVLYLRRGSVVAPVVSHAAFDLVQVLQAALH